MRTFSEKFGLSSYEFQIFEINFHIYCETLLRKNDVIAKGKMGGLSYTPKGVSAIMSKSHQVIIYYYDNMPRGMQLIQVIRY